MPYAATRQQAGSAADAARNMAELYGVPVVLERGDTALDSQRIIVDFHLSGSEIAVLQAAGVQAGQGGQVLVGLHGPPEVDVERGDQFVIDSIQYRVVLAHPNAEGAQRVAYAVGRQP